MTQQDEERFMNALHSMQSGVAANMNYDRNETEPKHLRVGINSAMCDTAAMVKLLVSKNVITMDEYWKFLADEAEAEAKRYADILTAHLGTPIILG